MGKGIVASIPVGCENVFILVIKTLFNKAKEIKWDNSTALVFKAINRLRKWLVCPKIDTPAPLQWASSRPDVLVQLHVETLGPGLQRSLVSEVHVDIRGEQIVHFVTLSGEKADRNQENEKSRHTCSCCWTHQWSFTQEFLPFNQTSDRHVKISASTGPACNAVEWMSCQHLLHEGNVQHIQKKCASTRGNAHVESTSFTLVLGWMMVSPCLLTAIKTMSGKCGSDVCWQQI